MSKQKSQPHQNMAMDNKDIKGDQFFSLASDDKGKIIPEVLNAKARDVKLLLDQKNNPHIFYISSGGSINYLYKPHSDDMISSDWAHKRLDGQALSIEVIQNNDGRFEVFHQGIGMRIYHQYQEDPANPSKWTKEKKLTGKAMSLSAIKDNSGRVYLFHNGKAGNIYMQYQKDPVKSDDYTVEKQLQGKAFDIQASLLESGEIVLSYVGRGISILGPWAAELSKLYRTDIRGWIAAPIDFVFLAYTGNNSSIYMNNLLFGRYTERFFSNLYIQKQKHANDPLAWEDQKKIPGKARQVAAAKGKDGKPYLFHIGQANRLYRRPLTVGSKEVLDNEIKIPGKAMAMSPVDNPAGAPDLVHVGRGFRLYYNNQPLGGHAQWVTAQRASDGVIHVVYMNHIQQLKYFNISASLLGEEGVSH